MHKPEMPAHRSNTSHVPLIAGVQGTCLLLLSGILEFFWALFFFKVRGVAGAAKNENQK